jgi:hypothetical protein
MQEMRVEMVAVYIFGREWIWNSGAIRSSSEGIKVIQGLTQMMISRLFHPLAVVVKPLGGEHAQRTRYRQHGDKSSEVWT